MQVGSLISTSVDYTNQQKNFAPLMVLKITCSCRGVVSDEYLARSIEGWIQYALIYVAMTDYPTASNFLNLLPAYPVKKVSFNYNG